MPSPNTSSEIANTLYKDMSNRSLENKIFIISIDCAANNNQVENYWKITIEWERNYFFGGKGIKSINSVVDIIYKTIYSLNASEVRLMRFVDIIQQL